MSCAARSNSHVITTVVVETNYVIVKLTEIVTRSLMDIEYYTVPDEKTILLL